MQPIPSAIVSQDPLFEGEVLENTGTGRISNKGNITGLGLSPVIGEAAGTGRISNKGNVTGLGSSPDLGIPYIREYSATSNQVVIEILTYHGEAVRHDMYRSTNVLELGSIVGEDIDPTQLFVDNTVSPSTTYYYTLKSEV